MWVVFLDRFGKIFAENFKTLIFLDILFNKCLIKNWKKLIFWKLKYFENLYIPEVIIINIKINLNIF